MAQPQTPDNAGRPNALFERPTMGVADPATFSAVKADVERCFGGAAVESFLRSLERASLRVRDFEAVLRSGKLGSATAEAYSKLAGGDQGQIRELYLALLERVELGLRDKFFKLYAYY